MKTVEVYSKADCTQCDSTYRSLDYHGVPFTVLRIDQVEEHMAKVKELGYLQAPVVVVTDEDGNVNHWSGFRVDKILQFAK